VGLGQAGRGGHTGATCACVLRPRAGTRGGRRAVSSRGLGRLAAGVLRPARALPRRGPSGTRRRARLSRGAAAFLPQRLRAGEGAAVPAACPSDRRAGPANARPRSRRRRAPSAGEFRRFCALARVVDAPSLEEALQQKRDHPSGAVRARARRVLDALGAPPWDAEQARARDEEHRLLSRVVTACNTRSASLARRVLSTDPAPLTSRGRQYLAVVFELAMNRGLLPDEELLAIAKRIEGPEMEPIWRFALDRHDAAGDRARWLLARLGRMP
jgi:hypothetical protein